jgi:integrase/recombinase XerD
VTPKRGRTLRAIPGDPADSQGFPVLARDFCEWMGVRGYSPRTIENNHLALVYLTEWLAERSITRPRDVTKPMLDSYQRSLYYRRKPDGSPITFRAQVVRLVPVRTFFRYLAKQNRILYNPASELELPKREHRLPRAVLSASEAELVLSLPAIGEPLGLRDRTMLELLYATGVRRSELANLKIFDVDIERQTLMVRQGKGRKDRMIPTGARAAAWVKRYLADARPRLARAPDEGTLFLTVEGEPFTPDRLTDLASLYVRRSGIGKPGACHLFRHTMATLMLEGGADIRFIQQMLGHADITSTQIYTQVSLAALSAVHAATHPAAANQPHSTRHGAGERERQGAVLRRASDLMPGAGAGGQDAAEALQGALDAEAQDEQQDLDVRPPRPRASS